MNLVKASSIVSLLLMLGGILGLIAIHSLFSRAPLVIALQVAAFALMVWSRHHVWPSQLPRRRRPDRGWLGHHRPVPVHPASDLHCRLSVRFAGALARPSLPAAGLALLVLAGALGRMLAEERLLCARYPEYADYAARTKRMLPYVF